MNYNTVPRHYSYALKQQKNNRRIRQGMDNEDKTEERRKKKEEILEFETREIGNTMSNEDNKKQTLKTKQKKE